MMKSNPRHVAGHKVEVKSLDDDGFLGSWHPATVLHCEGLSCVVEYEYILKDDGSSKLVERVELTPGDRWGGLCESRATIRPLPPCCGLSIHYGQCVDLFYNDAWWEGVVFDHEDGCHERRIFFPEKGDELVGSIDKLRISQDWDEATEEWKPRGNWILLELLEETEKDWPLPASAKQIWYEIRVKRGFVNLGGWTSLKRDIWKKLMKEVILDYCKLTFEHIFRQSNFNLSQELSESKVDAILRSEGFVQNPFAAVRDPFAVVPFGNSSNRHKCAGVRDSCKSLVSEQDNRVKVNYTSTPTMNHSEQALCVVPYSVHEVPGKSPKKRKASVFSEMDAKSWLPAVPDLVPGAEFCPSAIHEANKIIKSKRRPPAEVMLNVRKHLLYMGWTVEYMKEEGKQKFRYTSPDGIQYDSLQKLAPHVAAGSSRPASQTLSPPNYSESRLVVASQDIIPSPLLENSPSGRASNPRYLGDVVFYAEYCPEAVQSYAQVPASKGSCKSNIDWGKANVKAKQHLASIGWNFYYVAKSTGNRELRYRAPCGKLFNSLRTACIWCVKNNAVEQSNYLAITDGTEKVHCSENRNSPSPPHGSKPTLLLGSAVSEENLGAENGIHGNASPQVARSSKRIRNLVGSAVSEENLEGENGIHGNSSPQVLPRSSKRPSSNPNPRSTLSWLIDNDVVVPGSKVWYKKKDGTSKKNGEILRQGIKCSCCQEIFALSKFEEHAESTARRPSANIFLEDGRSLQDCQLELNRQKGNGRSSKLDNVTRTRHKITTDNVCSVCYVGGNVILCDRCPSIFHTQCLGLEEVPEGDWFCPSCCCKRCGSDFGKESKPGKQSDVLVCGQCEHKYHVGCIEADEMKDKTRHPEGYWFCCDACEQVFIGLREGLGKPIPLENGKTWTLLKYMESDSSENRSKLNIALNVMHECFEPLEDPISKSDVVKDVIFSKRSNLNRLNFEGFYTVILEDQDQMISAATVRIFGKEVAEVPLVATRFQYRRLGMCRVLMDQLEKMLKELGVVRLVLPAIPTVLNTWTSSFGFSRMSESERLNFLNYTFLGFHETTVCQKFLNLIEVPVTTSTSNPPSVILGEIDCDENIDLTDIEVDQDSLVSEVLQAEAFDIVGQGSTRIANNSNQNHETDSPQLAATVDQPSLETESLSHLIDSLSQPMEIVIDEKNSDTTSNAVTKIYTRRSLSKQTPLSEARMQI